MTNRSVAVTIRDSMKRWRLRTVSGLVSLYLFFCTIVVAMLFVVGNYQGFLESTNTFLLNLLEWVLFVFCISDLYYLIFYFYDLVKRKKRDRRRVRLTGLIWSSFGFAYGIVLLFALNLILIWL